MNPIPKVELRLNEENELSFKMSIEGTTSDPKSKPKFRFLVTDFGSDKGIVYPCTKEPNDVIKVVIPGLKENYNLGKKYLGKLEVIMGSLYFTPTELLISFKEPLKIKAAPVTVSPVAKDKNLQSKSVESDEELEDEEYDEEDEEIKDDEENEDDEEYSEEVSDDDEDSEDEGSEESNLEEDNMEEAEELMEKHGQEYHEEYHQLTSEAAEDKINLDEFFISDPAVKKEAEKQVLPPEAVEGFTQIAFAPAPKPGTVLLAPGFEGKVPENVQKTFTASGLPESSNKETVPFQESKLSKAATAAKNNLKKAFLEALTHQEVPPPQPKPQAEPIKEAAVKKNNSTLEEAKKLLMSAAEENRKRKITVSAKVSNVTFNKPRSLKDLFSKDFLE
jgi:hypothetical protein